VIVVFLVSFASYNRLSANFVISATVIFGSLHFIPTENFIYILASGKSLVENG